MDNTPPGGNSNTRTLCANDDDDDDDDDDDVVQHDEKDKSDDLAGNQPLRIDETIRQTDNQRDDWDRSLWRQPDTPQ